MPQTPHVERHFTSSLIVRDVVIGMADGLTVPFALAAGLSGAVNHADIIVTAGLAEIAAGSIAMGLGGYLAAKSDAEHYQAEQRREQQEVVEKPREEMDEVADIFRAYGIADEHIHPVVNAMRNRPKEWVDFMMRFELGLEKPDPARARTSAAVIAGAYTVGGLVPLLPYMIVNSVTRAMGVSVIVTLIALFIFGWVKGTFTGARPLKSALQTTITGGLAAAAAFLIARAIA
ncbi:MAG TPA: VIT1/CCC1 transporter family protein [Thermoanaerobaculia bacterium]|jgi:VIT1/CCC1 family predicted Fe2+/Mn2+ transporter|nr:VIT1/CCC1 transporter family protein [Thermoanaerobaculia bacterium]